LRALFRSSNTDGLSRAEASTRACLPFLRFGLRDAGVVRSTGSRYRVFTDEQWERIEPLLPSNAGRRGHPFGDHRRVVEGIAYRVRTGIPWRDLPREQFGPWQTVWKRHRRYAGDGTWDRVLARILAELDAAGKIDWAVSVDATIVRAHQHATNTTRPEQDTGGRIESQESALVRG
jgi:transposase